MALELTDIKNFEDLNAYTTRAGTDVLPIVDLSDTGDPDKKTTLDQVQKELVLGRKERDEQNYPDLVGITVSGWYEIADIQTTVAQPYNADFVISAFGSNIEETMSVHVSGAVSTSALKKVTCEIESHDYFSSNQIHIKGARLAYGLSAIGGGAKLEVYIDVVSGTVYLDVLKSNATSNKTSTTLRSTFNIKSPVASTGFLPDETTAATYLVAGMEIAFKALYPASRVVFQKGSSDVMRVAVEWPEIPYPGASTLTITWPSSYLGLTDGSGTAVTLTTGTVSSLDTLSEKGYVYFLLTNVGAFSTLNTGPLVVQPVGSELKLTLS